METPKQVTARRIEEKPMRFRVCGNRMFAVDREPARIRSRSSLTLEELEKITGNHEPDSSEIGLAESYKREREGIRAFADRMREFWKKRGHQ